MMKALLLLLTLLSCFVLVVPATPSPYFGFLSTSISKTSSNCCANKLIHSKQQTKNKKQKTRGCCGAGFCVVSKSCCCYAVLITQYAPGLVTFLNLSAVSLFAPADSLLSNYFASFFHPPRIV